MKKKFIKPAILISLLAILVIGGLWFYYGNNGKKTPQTVTQTVSKKITLNQTFDLPVGTEKDGLKPLKFTFQTAQLTNKISVNKKSQVAPKGTAYLMLNLLLENANTKGINLRSRDVIRLIDNNDKKFAPSIYNKDTPVQPDAVKKDTVGFLVPDSIKVFKIQYGPLTGEKKIIELNFENKK